VRRRVDVEYRPRDFEGEVRYLGAHYKYPERIVEEVADQVAAGKTVMVLAACSYMLEGVARELRAARIPFHNPYRPSVAAWHSRAGAEHLGDGEEPRVIIGTIHSVKGGQADSVFVMPDVSRPSWGRWPWRRISDEVRRLFYVAFTRAREELVLLDPATGRAVGWP
jgi:hypothetical protein